MPPPLPSVAAASPEPDYLPQSRITELPRLPTKELVNRIRYPEKAKKLGLQATVILDLFIDQTGFVRKVEVFRDPGHGFAEAAVQAFLGLETVPAKVAGRPAAVKFRYPVRFTLQ